MHRTAWSVAILLGLFLYLTASGRTSYFDTTPYSFYSSAFSFWRDGVPVLLTAFFAAFLGWSEIISRYRDEPLRATWTPYGLIYLLANALVALGVFALLERYPRLLPGVSRADGVLLAFFAGFGSMAVLRSKFFLYRTDDKREIPIGPDLVIDRFLRVVDRKIDRVRAAVRQKLIFERMRNFTQYAPAADFFDLALTSFQNLTDDEKKYYLNRVKELGALTSPEAFKAMALGYLFLDIAGENNLADVCANLDKYLQEADAHATKERALKEANERATPPAPAPTPPP